MESGSTFPDAPPDFIGDSEIAQLWQVQQRVFLFTQDREFEKVRSAIKGEMFQVAAAGEKSVYSNASGLPLDFLNGRENRPNLMSYSGWFATINT